MKKLISILLTLAMILAMTVTAFAADDKTTITIEEPQVGTIKERTYDAFRLLNLKVSHKEAGHDYICPKEKDANAKCVDDCFNYNYSIPENSPFLPILQKK